MRVLADPLYPPLNRTDSQTFRSVVVASSPPRHTDTFRLVGYVVSSEAKKDSGGNTWKLFARQKDRNMSEFYLISANSNYDVKIALTPEMAVPRLRDVYTIPNDISFKSPLLHTTPYQFTELPKSDLADSGPYF